MSAALAPRLSQQALPVPLGYDRAGVRPGIVHLGVGAFHRAHMAEYCHDILPHDARWGIIGASLRRGDVAAALAPQNFLYAHVTRGAGAAQVKVIGSLLDVIDASQSPEALLAAMASASTRIVSLTVTEKGYCLDPNTRTLDFNHPDIKHDLLMPEAPVSAIGLIVRGLELRRAAGLAPFSVMSCDNIPANGEVVARATTAFAERRDAGLARHIGEDVAFPATMVDRIVPATTDADRSEVLAALGVEDHWPVQTEPFRQWVIEDHFCNGRPAFERAGAQLVGDVRPYEVMKLRLLNGSHSTLAYLGLLSGHDHVNEAIGDANLRRLVAGMMREEIMPTLPASLGDLEGYGMQLLKRFDNPALQHKLMQIAMDGSQKLPQRLLAPLRERLAKGQGVERLALAIASWMRFAMGRDEQGLAIEIKDPMAPRFKQVVAAAGIDVAPLVRGFLGIQEIFGADLVQNAALVALLRERLRQLLEQGTRATVAQVVAKI